MRKASIKETGEELSPAEWARFDAAVARLKAERDEADACQKELGLFEEHDAARRRQNNLQDCL